MRSENDSFLAENIHCQLDLRSAYRDLGDRSMKCLEEIAQELSIDSSRIGLPQADEYKGSETLTYWVDCTVKDSREFSWLTLGVEFDTEAEFQGRTGAVACVWLTPRDSVRDRFEEMNEIVSRDLVGPRPRQEGTVWRDDGSIGMKLASRKGKPWPTLPELEKDLGILFAEALRLIEAVAKKKK